MFQAERFRGVLGVEAASMGESSSSTIMASSTLNGRKRERWRSGKVGAGRNGPRSRCCAKHYWRADFYLLDSSCSLNDSLKMIAQDSDTNRGNTNKTQQYPFTLSTGREISWVPRVFTGTCETFWQLSMQTPAAPTSITQPTVNLMRYPHNTWMSWHHNLIS